MAVDVAAKKLIFRDVLAETLSEVHNSEDYTFLKSEYDEGRLELEDYFRIRNELNSRYMPLAFGFAADIAKEDPNKDEKSALELERLQCEKDTLCLQKDILSDERAVRKNILNAELLVKQKQYLVEDARAKLLVKQRIGFDDNVMLERYKASAEVIGMIQSGGNEAPQQLFDELALAIAHLRTIDSHHEEG